MTNQLTESDLRAAYLFLMQMQEQLHPYGRISVRFSDDPEIAQRQHIFLQIKQKIETK